MIAKDVSGQHRSYLSSEENFALVKSLQAANLIVPIVGDFGGPSALKRTGEYVREHSQIVTTFYSSNVEVYLNREKSAAVLPQPDRAAPRLEHLFRVEQGQAAAAAEAGGLRGEVGA